jgi:hypothetical protein
MRYTVDPAELRRAVDLVTRAVLGRRGGASRGLERVAGGLPRGVTTSLLPDLVARWRARERRFEAGLVDHAEHLGAAVDGYERVEAEAAKALDEERP